MRYFITTTQDKAEAAELEAARLAAKTLIADGKDEGVTEADISVAGRVIERWFQDGTSRNLRG